MTLKFDTKFFELFFAAQSAVIQVNRSRYDHELGDYTAGPREWFQRIVYRYDLHPVVYKIVQQGVRPVDWHLLLLEWPHVADTDETMIAYTRTEAAGQSFHAEGSKRLTKTSIGKYLSRHWPHVADHIRRDWQGSFGHHKYAIWDTKEMIISGVELGPQSCMKSSYGSIPFSRHDNNALIAWHADKSVEVNWNSHPYAVYAPELGWRMAVRLDPGKPDIVMGRALVQVDDKVFVRSYTRGESEGSYSHTDERLETWLREQGYSKNSDWEGYFTLALNHPDGGYMMPYLDGGVQRAELSSGKMLICSDGEYECDNTNASAGDGRESYGTCEDCDETVYEDDEDRIWAGQNDERLVGGACGCANSYTYVRGAHRYGSFGRFRNYTEYYINSNDAIEVDGNDYDPENLPDNIVETADGDYAEKEECVECADGDWRLRDDCIEVEDQWYAEDDEAIVQCADDEYRLRDNCWESAEGNWYSEDESQVDVTGGTYHPDELREMADNA